MTLALQLANRGQGAIGTKWEEFQSQYRKSLWCQKDYNFQPSFLDTLAQNYGAGVNLLDFINSPEPSRVDDKHWVSNETNNKNSGPEFQMAQSLLIRDWCSQMRSISMRLGNILFRR